MRNSRLNRAIKLRLQARLSRTLLTLDPIINKKESSQKVDNKTQSMKESSQKVDNQTQNMKESSQRVDKEGNLR